MLMDRHRITKTSTKDIHANGLCLSTLCACSKLHHINEIRYDDLLFFGSITPAVEVQHQQTACNEFLTKTKIYALGQI